VSAAILFFFATAARRVDSFACSAWGSFTRAGGADVVGDGADRVRALIVAIRGFAPAAKLDSATRAVCDQGAPVRQIADAAELAAHDERLP